MNIIEIGAPFEQILQREERVRTARSFIKPDVCPVTPFSRYDVA
jgi:hypothetical protein